MNVQLRPGPGRPPLLSHAVSLILSELLSHAVSLILSELAQSRVLVCIQGIGTMFREGRILCVLQVTTEHVLLGTQSGKIWVFNTLESKLVHASKQLQDSVLCLHLISR